MTGYNEKEKRVYEIYNQIQPPPQMQLYIIS